MSELTDATSGHIGEESNKAESLEINKTPSPHLSLDELVAKNDIKLAPGVREFCEVGIQLMHESKDPAHNVGHLERLHAGIDNFLAENPQVQVDLNVFLIAADWHDIWRATNFSPNLLKAIYHDRAEGIAGARFVTERMQEVGFDKALIDQVRYCVRKHNDPQLLPRTSVESQILHDLDYLDSWSPERLEEIKAYVDKSPSAPVAIPILRRLKGVLLARATHKYYLESSQRESDTRVPYFRQQVEELLG